MHHVGVEQGADGYEFAATGLSVTIAEVPVQFRAIELTGATRAAAFAHAMTLNPGWTRFQHSAGDR